jgi:hypothetical protein
MLIPVKTLRLSASVSVPRCSCMQQHTSVDVKRSGVASHDGEPRTRVYACFGRAPFPRDDAHATDALLWTRVPG